MENERIPKILFVGNSYTYFQNLPERVSEIAAAAGSPVLTDSVSAGGHRLCELTDPSDECGILLEQKRKAGRYDVVFLQDYSTEPIRHPERFAQSMRYWVSSFHADGARVILYQTWARKQGSVDLTANNLTNRTMTVRLEAAYRNAALSCGADLSPVGSAFYEVNSEYPGIELYQADKSHPSDAGTCLAALCHWALISGQSVSGLSYPCGSVPEETLSFLRAAADRAVAEHGILFGKSNF